MNDERRSNNRSDSTRDRIRERVRRNRGSGDGNGDSGSGSGERSDTRSDADAGSSDSSASELQLRAASVSDRGNGEQDSGGLRLLGKRGNRQRVGRSDGDRSSPDNSGRSDSPSGQLFTESPSLIRVADVLTLDDSGELRVRTRRTRKPRVSSTKKANLDELVFPLKIACDFIFGLPVALGWGAHWALKPEENEALATDIKSVLEAFPSSTTTEFIKAIEKYIPILVLGMTLYQIIRPRVEETQRLLKVKKEVEAQLHAEIERTEESRITDFTN